MYRISHLVSRLTPCLSCVFAATLTAVGVSVCGADETTAERIGALSNSARRGYLRAVIEDYREVAQRISTEETQYAQIVPYDNDTGQLGREVLQSTTPEHFRLARNGASYRMKRWQQSVEERPNTSTPVSFEASYDANEEICRALSVNTENGQTSYDGSIRKGILGPGDSFIYRYFGDGLPPRKTEDRSYLSGVDWLLQQLDRAHVSISRDDDGIVEATFPFKESANRVSRGKVCFDLNRSGMVSGFVTKTYKRIGDAKDRIPLNTFELVVDKAVEVNGIWIPTRARGLAWSARKPNTMTIWYYEVSVIGPTETPAEIHPVAFPVGTTVSDRINFKRYDVGPDGRRINERDTRVIGVLE